MNPEPLPHHDAAVCDLIAAAFQAGLDQGRIEAHEATVNAIREDERRAAGVDL